MLLVSLVGLLTWRPSAQPDAPSPLFVSHRKRIARRRRQVHESASPPEASLARFGEGKPSPRCIEAVSTPAPIGRVRPARGYMRGQSRV
jgi:hypothetical protein